MDRSILRGRLDKFNLGMAVPLRKTHIDLLVRDVDRFAQAQSEPFENPLCFRQILRGDTDMMKYQQLFRHGGLINDLRSSFFSYRLMCF
jgi:hypothetical protein